MPTGYTQYILDGASFEEFVLKCARAFGACIDMRDDPMNSQIKEFKVDKYYYESLEEAQKKLEEWQGLSEEQQQAKYYEHVKEREESKARTQEKDRETRARYKEMFFKVSKWSPPTEDHSNLKKFMLEQIEESIQFDCHGNYDWHHVEPYNIWKAKHITHLHNSVRRSKESLEKQIEKTERNNKWITKLMESLNTTTEGYE